MRGALCTRTNDEGEISYVLTYAAKELGPSFPIQLPHNIIDSLWVLYTKNCGSEPQKPRTTTLVGGALSSNYNTNNKP